MLTKNVRSPRWPRSMDPGVLRTYIAEFTNHLSAQKYTTLTIAGYEDSACHFAEWLQRSNIALVNVDEKVMARFSQHRCRCRGIRRHKHVSAKYARRARRFIHFLAERGIVPSYTPKSSKVVNTQVSEFQEFLRHHRGISERTISRHSSMIMRLLPALGDDPQAYNAELIRKVIVSEAERSSRPYVQAMTKALRCYLRFLAANGLCQSLDRAVPTVPHWRLSALPLYLPAADVERLIASCDLTKTHGIRDKAILLLLSRLGLRAGDILGMRLDDVEWNEGALRVRGKGRREVRLPLPQDAGDALLEYLETARPLVDHDRIFLRSSAPYRPFADPASIADVVGLALRRARIANPPSRGANLLRHSAATAMLRGGATLDAIGSVLRHQSPDMTAHYAKVDVVTLLQIAQPWPGELSC